MYGRWILGAIVVLTFVGCSRSGRVGVEGAVTLDGTPLEKGSIQFRPAAGTAGPTAGGDIANGKFSIPAERGPFAGKFTVQISSAGCTGRRVLDPRTNAMTDEYGERLPAQYNSQSQLQADVASSGVTHLEFALKSEKAGR